MPGRRGGLAFPAAVAVMAVTALLASACGSTTRADPRPSVTPTPTAPATEQPVVLAQVASRSNLDLPGGSAVVLRPAHPTAAPVVYVHALGETAESLVTDALKAPMVAALLRAGHVVAAADAYGRNWGNPASLTAYTDLVRHLDPHDRGVDVLAESMGGYDALRLPDVHRVLAVAAISPACNLPVLHDGQFRDSVETAWGPALAAGLRELDPAVARDWHGVALHVWASPGDTIVPASSNGYACAALARSRGASVTVTRNSGNHEDPSGFVPSAVVALFARRPVAPAKATKPGRPGRSGGSGRPTRRVRSARRP